MGKIHVRKPMKTKTRKELIASVRPQWLPYFRADNCYLPEGSTPSPAPVPAETADLRVLA